MTLLARLFLLVLLAVLPALTIQLHGVLQRRADREQEIVVQAERLLQMVEREQTHLIASARLMVAAVTEAAFLRSGDFGRCQDYLVRLVARSADYRTISVAGRDGRILCSGAPENVGASILDQPHFRRALDEDRFVVGEWQKGFGGAAGELPVAAPFEGRDGTVGGVVTVALDVPWLTANFSTHPLPETADLMVTDRAGQILVRLPKGVSAAGVRLPPSYLDLVNDDRPGVRMLPGVDGIARVVAYSPANSGLEGLFIGVGIDQAEAMAGIDRTTREGLAMTLLGLLVAVAAAWIGGTIFLRRPIAALVRTAQSWREGDSSARAGLPDRESELGRLGLAFDAMAETLEVREAAVRQSERHTRAVLDALPAFVGVLGPDGVVVQVNQAVAQLAGLPPGRIIGRTLREICWCTFDEDGRTRFREAMGRAMNGESARFDVVLRLTGDQVVDIDVGLTPMFDGERRITHVIASGIDVTERKRAEAELRHAREEADRANVAKSKFLATASHDLRQPVQSLYLFSAALADRLQGHPGLPLLDNMRQGLDTLKSLLDGLLDMSRLESGRIAVVPVDVRLNQLLGRLVAEYGPRAAQKGLELRAVPSRAWVRSDPAHLERILRNLIENALRYTRQGRILLGCRMSGPDMRIEVWDSGIGIPQDRLDEIFDEFTQLGERNGRGLGLGLAIVRRLSQLLGHRVTVRSSEGRGSVFTVSLPRVTDATGFVAVRTKTAAAAGAFSALASASGLVRTAVANDAAGRGMVLVIDDEAIILLGLKAMLEGWGYDVLTARTGDQALERLRADGRRPRIVLADYQLQQGRTGPEALCAVQAFIGRDIPGVILTGDTAPERLKEAQSSGFRILHKPVFPNELRRVLATAGAV